MVNSIVQGSQSSTFLYGPEHQRVKQSAAYNGQNIAIWYLDGFELEKNTTNNTSEVKYYIAGKIIHSETGTAATPATTQTKYLHKDHLGSVTLITSSTGAVLERYSLDAWRKREQTVRAVDAAVSEAFEVHEGRAGAPCLTGDVHALGVRVSERTVGRSLSRQGLRCHSRLKFRHTTDSNHKLPVAPNLLDRNFTVSKPNQVWVGDITYIQTSEGWPYLAIMIDLFNRQVVGWQMSARIDQTLVNDALRAALISRGKPRGVMVHTDRGSQYCAHSFKRILADHDMVQSMSRKGNCWDNAVAESFFATLKKQGIHGHALKTRQQMRQHVFEFIEIYYNRVRRHSANGWRAPVEFEALYNQNLEGLSVH